MIFSPSKNSKINQSLEDSPNAKKSKLSQKIEVDIAKKDYNTSEILEKKSNKKEDESNQEKNLLNSYISRKNKNVLYEENNKANKKNKESSGFTNKVKKKKKKKKKSPIESPKDKIEKNEELDNYELNNLDYDAALRLDKREMLDIYWSILKREHLIIFTFFIRNDHNILCIKISRLFFLICTDMAFNVFFFADETMHKMYLDYGKYDFAQQIPQIIYSTAISQVIEVILCFLSLTDKYHYQLKHLDNKNNVRLYSVLRRIKLKIILFYIFTFIMFMFYWYLITCFCAVYENTQIAFIKDSISSFGFGLLYTFILYLIPAILRIISLRYCVGKLSVIYVLSDIIPFF